MANVEVTGKDLARRFIEAGLGRGDLRALAECLAPDVRYDGGVMGGTSGSDGMIAAVAEYRQALSDLRVDIADQLADGDLVCTRFTVSGKHTGPFAGLDATGLDIEFQVINIVRIEDGRIVEVWSEADQLTLLEQLGVL